MKKAKAIFDKERLTIFGLTEDELAISQKAIDLFNSDNYDPEDDNNEYTRSLIELDIMLMNKFRDLKKNPEETFPDDLCGYLPEKVENGVLYFGPECSGCCSHGEFHVEYEEI